MPATSVSTLSLPVEERSAEEIIAGFESAWLQGKRPELDDHLPFSSDLRKKVIPDLVRIDLQCRLNCKEAMRVESYLERFPEVAENREAVLDLVVREFRQRQRAEPGLSPGDYLDRFPSLQDELAARLQPDAPASPATGPALRQGSAGFGQIPATAEVKPEVPTIPGHEITGILRQDARATVYRARHEKLNRWVAVAVFAPEFFTDAEKREKVLTEVRAFARLHHPNIVAVHEAGEHDGKAYVTLDMTERTLESYLIGAPVAPRTCAELIEKMAGAVHCGHRQGVVHGRIQPRSVALVPREIGPGSGEAKGGEGGAEPAGSPSLAGWEPKLHFLSSADVPPQYLAPEQASDGNPITSRATDIHSLGLILYEILSGTCPFRGADRQETLDQVRTLQPVPPSLLNPRVPRDLDAVCLQCLRKEPGRRYQSAQELALDLGRFLAGKPVFARANGPVERTMQFLKREPRITTIIAGIMLIFVVAWVLGLSRSRQGGEDQDRAASELAQAEARAREAGEKADAFRKRMEQAEQRAASMAEKERQARVEQDQAARAAAKVRTIAEKAEKAEQLARRQHYRIQLNTIHRLWQSDGKALVPDLLDRLAPEYSGGQDFRGFEWFHFHGLIHPDLGTLSGHPAAVRGVSFDPRGKQLASIAGPQSLKLWGLAGLNFVDVPNDGPGSWTVYSPDGRFLLTDGRDHAIQVRDAGTGKPIATLNGHQDAVDCAAFSPDGRVLATGSRDLAVKLWDAADWKLIRSIAAGPDPVRTIAFSPDGRLLASAGGGTVSIRDSWTGGLLQTIPTSISISTIAFHPGGGWLAAGGKGKDRSLILWDTAEFRASSPLPGSAGDIQCMTFTPDGRLLITDGNNGLVRIWNIQTQKEVGVIPTGQVYGLAVSADARLLATAGADKSVKLWDLGSMGNVPALPPQTSPARTIAFHPDGRRIAFGNGGQIVVAGADSRELLLSVAGHEGAVASLAYSPDGKTLASAGADSKIKFWDAETLKEIRLLDGHTGGVTAIAFRGDGQRLFSTGEDRTIRIWDTESGKQLHLIGVDRSRINALAVSPDGRRFATAADDGKIHVWDPETLRPAGLLLGHRDAVNGIAFSPDGKRLASAGADRTVRVWEVDSPNFEILAGDIAFHGVGFSPDGRRLCGAGESLRVWDARTLEEICTFRCPGGAIRSIAFAPSGELLAGSCEDRTIRLWGRTSGGAGDLHGRRAAIWPGMPGWHAAQAAEQEQKGQWFAAAFHLGRLIVLQPKDPALRVRRAEAYRQRQQWLEAAADYSRALELRPDLPVRPERDRCLGRSLEVRSAVLIGLSATDPLSPLVAWYFHDRDAGKSR